MTLKKIYWLMLLIVVSGCLQAQTDVPIKADEKPTLIVAQLYALSHTAAFVSFQQDFLQKELGDSVEIKRIFYPNGGEIISAMRNGDIDIAYVGASYPISSVMVKPNLKIIAGTNIGGHAIVIKVDNNIQQISDLKGKTVGVHAYGSPDDVLFRSVVLPQGGLNPSDVSIAKTKSPELLTKLKEGSLDAVHTHEPWVSRILLNTDIKTTVLVDWVDIWRDGSYPTSTVAVRNQILANHPDWVKKFLSAHVDAVVYVNEHPAETRKIMHDEILQLSGKELPQEVIDSAFTRVKITYDPHVEAVMELADFTHQAYTDMLPRTPTKDELFDLTLLNEVLEEKGLATVDV